MLLESTYHGDSDGHLFKRLHRKFPWAAILNRTTCVIPYRHWKMLLPRTVMTLLRHAVPEKLIYLVKVIQVSYPASRLCLPVAPRFGDDPTKKHSSADGPRPDERRNCNHLSLLSENLASFCFASSRAFRDRIANNRIPCVGVFRQTFPSTRPSGKLVWFPYVAPIGLVTLQCTERRHGSLKSLVCDRLSFLFGALLIDNVD